MRWLCLALALLELGSCHREPARPTAGRSRRRATVSLSGIDPVSGPVASDPTGEVSWISSHDGRLARVDWRTGRVDFPNGVRLWGRLPVLLRARDDRLEWPGGGGAPRPAGLNGGGVWLDAGAAVPLITGPRGHGLSFEGWRGDGTRAWHRDLGAASDIPPTVAHLGDVVLIQTPGTHDAAAGLWRGGTTVALDARTGKTLWRRDAAPGKTMARANRIVGHGDEAALLFEDDAHIEVIAVADGSVRRKVKMSDTFSIHADSLGFDGEVVWSYEFDARHENPGSDILGTGPRPDSPASCQYRVWDTRHDRGHPVRTLEDLPAGWRSRCDALAMLPLAGGGVQVLLRPDDFTLVSLWLTGPP